MRSAEAQLHIIDFKERLHKLFEHPLEVGHRDVLIQRQPLDLVEHRRMRLVIIRAVHTARANHADRRALLFHAADLHGAGMRAQHMRGPLVALGTVHIERVHLRARRVMPWNVERIKVIPIGVDPRPLGHGKAHVSENRGDFLSDLRNRVNAPLPAQTAGQCHIQPLAAQPLIKRRILKPCLLSCERRVNLVFQSVELRPSHLPLLGSHLAQLPHLKAHFALFADRLQAQVLKRGFIRRSRNRRDVFVS